MTPQVPGWSLPTPTMRHCELCPRRAPDVAATVVKWRDGCGQDRRWMW